MELVKISAYPYIDSQCMGSSVPPWCHCGLRELVTEFCSSVSSSGTYYSAASWHCYCLTYTGSQRQEVDSSCAVFTHSGATSNQDTWLQNMVYPKVLMHWGVSVEKGNQLLLIKSHRNCSSSWRKTGLHVSTHLEKTLVCYGSHIQLQ